MSAQGALPLAEAHELADATFQAVITLGLAALAVVLHRWFRERWLAWWAAAWGLYVVRLLAIIAFLTSGDLIWLFWHQVITGWVALAILWAALVFSRNSQWRNRYLTLAVVPLILGWLAVRGLDEIALMAIPMVVLLSGVTLWTGSVFWRHANSSGSIGSRFVAIAFFLWGLHHLDYTILRARGAWAPWGYFLDIGFELAVGIGFALMALGELTDRLAERTTELARLQGRLVRSEEDERRRLARELHDESAQTFSAARLEIGILSETADTTTRAGLDRVKSLVDRGIAGIRRVINDLRPALLDDLGLLAAIRSLADEIAKRDGIMVRLELPDQLPPLSTAAELSIFRGVQEALINISRHADASTVTIGMLKEGDRLRVTVRDDGRGFPTDSDLATFETAGRLGLVGMRERIAALGGTVEVDGADGVTVTILIPQEGRDG